MGTVALAPSRSHRRQRNLCVHAGGDKTSTSQYNTVHAHVHAHVRARRIIGGNRLLFTLHEEEPQKKNATQQAFTRVTHIDEKTSQDVLAKHTYTYTYTYTYEPNTVAIAYMDVCQCTTRQYKRVGTTNPNMQGTQLQHMLHSLCPTVCNSNASVSGK